MPSYSAELLLASRLTPLVNRLIIRLAMDIYEQIVELRRQGRRGAVATIVNVRGSIPSFKTAKMLVRDDGSIVGTIGGGCVEADVWQAAREVMESEKPRTLKFDLNQDPKYDTGTRLWRDSRSIRRAGTSSSNTLPIRCRPRRR